MAARSRRPTACPVEEIQNGIRYGVRKVNIDTDFRLAMTGQCRQLAAEKPDEFDPRKFFKPAMDGARGPLRAPVRGSSAAPARPPKLRPLPLAEMARRYRGGALDPQIAPAPRSPPDRQSARGDARWHDSRPDQEAAPAATTRASCSTRTWATSISTTCPRTPTSSPCSGSRRRTASIPTRPRPPSPARARPPPGPWSGPTG